MQWGTKVVFILTAIYGTNLWADISTDGSLGQATSLSGPNYQIDASLGTQAGSNLFHSFSNFSIQNGETASFNGSNSINNVIGRVTGDQASNIDGTIHSDIPNANIYLINPDGILFGANAKLDIQGSFHGLTSDYVELGDGSRFYSSISPSSTLTSAPPSAFGFLTDSPANIRIESEDLSVETGKNISLIGGNVDISVNQVGKSGIRAQNGSISIISMGGAGEVSKTGSGFTVTDDQLKGTINIHGNARIRTNTTNSTNAGNINMQAANITIQDNVKINSDTRGTGSAGNISVQADSIIMSGDTDITTNSFSNGNAGNISITTDELVMKGLALLNSTTFDGAGNAGEIEINTQSMRMENDATITTVAHQDTTGNAGNITITAKDVSITGEGTGAEQSALISSNVLANTSGHGGIVSITTNTLSLANDGTVSVSSKGTGDAGSINIAVANSLTSDHGFIQSRATTADGGDITINTNERVDLRDSEIRTSVTDGNGSGGNINLNLDDSLLILDDSKIIADSEGGKGGDINFRIGTYIRTPSPGTEVSAKGKTVNFDGSIEISVPESNLSKAVKQLDANLLTNNVKDPCSIQVASDESSLKITKSKARPICVKDMRK